MTLKNHYVHLENGKLASTSRQEISGMFNALINDSNKDTLVIFFHGGLVSFKSAEVTAETLLVKYKDAGAYPIFFIWESFITETIANNFSEILQKNLTAIFDEKIFKRILTRVTQFVIAKYKEEEGTRGGRLELESEFQIDEQLKSLQPRDDLIDYTPQLRELSREQISQFEEALGEDAVITREAEKIANSLRTKEEVVSDYEETRGARVQGSTETLMSPEILEEIRDAAPSPEERGAVSTITIIKYTVEILIKVITRLAKKRGHGVYPTIIEEILRKFYVANAGKFLWEHMKKDTADSFGDDPAVYGGTAFLEELKKHWEAGYHPRIILVGHSAGTVYISHFLKHADRRLPPEVKFDIILLASAVSFSLFSKTLTDHGHRIQNVRQFSMRDALEKQDHLIPVVPIYPYSLLYFVSGILEDEPDKPLVGMQRFYTELPPFNTGVFPEVDLVRQFFAQSDRRMVWSEDNLGEGLASHAKRHGEFNTVDSLTIDSVLKIIERGF